jgi:FkbM family methyltransferase
MSLILKAAHQFHRFFPFAQLRTANWILKRNPNGTLMPAKLFGYEVSLQARTSVHVLLSIEGEGFVQDSIFLGPHLREGMTAIDVGANIGYLTLFFCHRVGAQGQVFAFEPEPDNFRELVRSIEHNHIKWCTPLNLAVGASDGPASLTFGLNGYIRPDRAGEPNCCMVSLDSFAAQRAIPRIDFVKIDVEGFEADVLLGMSKILERHRPIIYVEVHPAGFCGSGDPRKVCSLLRRHYDNITSYRVWADVRQHLQLWDKIRGSFGADDMVRNKCRTTLKEVMESQQHRYQLVALP